MEMHIVTFNPQTYTDTHTLLQVILFIFFTLVIIWTLQRKKDSITWMSVSKYDERNIIYNLALILWSTAKKMEIFIIFTSLFWGWAVPSHLFIMKIAIYNAQQVLFAIN